MKKFLFYLSFVGLMLTACSKDDGEESGGKLPPLPNPNDVCSGMDDANFIKYCYKNFDLNGDGAVSPSEAAAVHEIDVYSERIESLTGICYFPNLEKLKSELDHETDFKWNTTLRRLELNGRFQKINLSQNKNLQELIVRDSKLTELDLSNNMALQWVSVGDGSSCSSLIKKVLLPNVERLHASFIWSSIDLVPEFPATLRELDLYTDAMKVMFRSVTPPSLRSHGDDYYSIAPLDNHGNTILQKIYVPKEAVGTYKSAWPKFANIIEGY